MLALMMLSLFVVVPLAMGYAIPEAMAARVAWLVFGAVMAYSQARDDDLGSAWPLVGAIVVLGLLLVEVGRRRRMRDERK